MLSSCVVISPQSRGKEHVTGNAKAAAAVLFFFPPVHFSWMFKRIPMQWKCSSRCYVLTACHFYLTGLPDGIRTDRFGSLLTWPCIELLVGMIAQLKCDTVGTNVML